MFAWINEEFVLKLCVDWLEQVVCGISKNLTNLSNLAAIQG